MRIDEDERGQASVELVALLPLIALVGLACWQLVVAGQAWWLAGSAARAAGRAAQVGTDPGVAARTALPANLAAGVRVLRHDGGRVEVRVAIPAVVGGARLGTVEQVVDVPGDPS